MQSTGAERVALTRPCQPALGAWVPWPALASSSLLSSFHPTQVLDPCPSISVSFPFQTLASVWGRHTTTKEMSLQTAPVLPQEEPTSPWAPQKITFSGDLSHKHLFSLKIALFVMRSFVTYFF